MENIYIYETNGIGKEYNSYNDELLFEGEYKNGERNGKGKEYNKFGDVLFEGEYKNGERNGKGQEYNFYRKKDKKRSEFPENEKNSIIFEGEYN